MTFYTSVFHKATVGDILRYDKDDKPDKPGTIKHAIFNLEGQDSRWWIVPPNMIFLSTKLFLCSPLRHARRNRLLLEKTLGSPQKPNMWRGSRQIWLLLANCSHCSGTRCSTMATRKKYPAWLKLFWLWRNLILKLSSMPTKGNQPPLIFKCPTMEACKTSIKNTPICLNY